MTGLPFEPIEGDSTINVPSPSGSNADLPAQAMPNYPRIVVTDLVGPTAANKQHKAAEKRTLTLIASLQRMAAVLAAIDNVYLRKDSSTSKDTHTGATANFNLGGHKAINAAAAAATGELVRFDEFAALVASDALKAPLISPGLTGTPTAPTADPGTNTTQLATTAFVQALAGSIAIATGEIVLTGSGSWTVPPSVFWIDVLIVGAGGGGGASTDGSGGSPGSLAGSGGGRGGALRRRIPVTPGQIINYTCGAGGAGAASTGGATVASDGTDTTFLGLVAPHGTGGHSAAGLTGINGADDPHIAEVFTGPLPTKGVSGGNGGNGGGWFLKTFADSSGNLLNIGKFGAGALALAGGFFGGGPGSPGYALPGGAGGLGCGGGGNGAADFQGTVPGGAGGNGFVHIRWGLA